MKIALINENSQAAKNELIFNTLNPGHAVGQGHAEPADGVDDEFGKALHG